MNKKTSISMLLVACAPAFAVDVAQYPEPVQAFDQNIQTKQSVRSEDRNKELWEGFFQNPQIKKIVDVVANIVSQQVAVLQRAAQLQAQAQSSNPVDRLANQIALDQSIKQADALSQKQEKLLARLSPEQQVQVKAWVAKKQQLDVLTNKQEVIQQAIKKNQDQMRELQTRKSWANDQAMASAKITQADLKSKLATVKQERSQLANESRNAKIGRAKVQKAVNKDASALINVMRNDEFVKNVDRQTLAQLNSVMRNARLNDQAKYNSLIAILAQVDARKVSKTPTKQQIEQAKKELNVRLEAKLHEMDQGMAEKWVSIALQSSNPQNVLNAMGEVEKNPQAVALAKSMFEAQRWAQGKQDMLKKYMDFAHKGVKEGRFKTLDVALRSMLVHEKLSEGVLNHLVKGMVSKKGNAPVQQNMQKKVQDDVQALNGQKKQELANKLGVSVNDVENVVSGKAQLSHTQLIGIGDDVAYALGVARSTKNNVQVKTDEELDSETKEAIARSLTENYKVQPVDRLDRVASGQQDLSHEQERAIGYNTALKLGISRSMENNVQVKTDEEFDSETKEAIARSLTENYKVD